MHSPLPRRDLTPTELLRPVQDLVPIHSRSRDGLVAAGFQTLAEVLCVADMDKDHTPLCGVYFFRGRAYMDVERIADQYGLKPGALAGKIKYTQQDGIFDFSVNGVSLRDQPLRYAAARDKAVQEFCDSPPPRELTVKLSLPLDLKGKVNGVFAQDVMNDPVVQTRMVAIFVGVCRKRLKIKTPQAKRKPA